VVYRRSGSGMVAMMTSSRRGRCGGSCGSGTLAAARQAGHETAAAASGGVSGGRHFDLLVWDLESLIGLVD
jgi:hypothetical protein